MLCELLEQEWDTGLNDKPTFTYQPESLMVNARLGTIHVERLTRTNGIDTSDYRTVRRNSYLSVKISCRFRETMLSWGEEFYRIIMENRRAPTIRPWEFMEISAERPTPDLSGWYTTVFDIKLTRYCEPIRSHGFGRAADQFKSLPDGEGHDAVDDPGECDSDLWTGGLDADTPDDPCDDI